MTLDILSFIDNKGGNAEEIRESQRKRGHDVEIVDQVIAMYAEWVKSQSRFSLQASILIGEG
jgi:seryl-tRNA synthetase